MTAFAPQSCSRYCSPAPDLFFSNDDFPTYLLLRRSGFFIDTGIAGFQTGSGQTCVLQKCRKNHTMLPRVLPRVCLLRTFCQQCLHVANIIRTHANRIHVAMEGDYGKLIYFFDTPVFPDPVWKLSFFAGANETTQPGPVGDNS